MIRNTCLAAALALIAAPLAATADDKKPFDDATFVKMAGIGGMYEVELGKVAAGKAKSGDVKMFAEKMVKDHSKACEELKAAAKAAGLTVPEKLDEKHQKKVDMFAGKTDDFDTAYVKDMVKDHEEDVALFTRASKELKDPKLKEFATKTLPTLKEHLAMIKKLDK